MRTPRGWRDVLRVAGRELRIVLRGRGAVTGLLVLAALTWIPPLLLPLRGGGFGVAPFVELLPLAVAAEGVVLPLVALLFGAEMLAGETERGSLPSLVTLPLSRTDCFLGKLLGRLAVLAGAEVALFGAAASVLAVAGGTEGLAGYVAVQVSALLLSAACVAIGAALAAGGRDRVGAYAVTLLAWVTLVFVVDGVLLAAIVSVTPPAPTSIGEHGHSELSEAMPLGPPNADTTSETTAGPSLDRPGAWLLTLDPVDLFRLGGLAADADANDPTRAMVVAPLAVGWLAWLAVPTLVGVVRFRTLPLH